MIDFDDKYRDAVRRGLQAAVAAAAFFVVARAYDLPEVFVGTLSAVLILSASSDGSLKSGFDRVLSTLVGSAIAVACVFTLPPEWGTLIALGMAVAVMAFVSVLRPNWQYGLVATIALSIGATHDLLDVTVDRLVSIGIGAAIGIVVSFTVWPERAAGRYQRHRADVLTALTGRLARLEAAARDGGDDIVSPEDDREYHVAYGKLLEAKDAKSVGEVSGANEEVRAIRRVYNSIIILDRVLEDGACGTAEFEPMIDGVRKRLCALAENDGKALSDEIGCPVDEPDLHAAMRFGMHELTTETGRLSEVKR